MVACRRYSCFLLGALCVATIFVASCAKPKPADPTVSMTPTQPSDANKPGTASPSPSASAPRPETRTGVDYFTALVAWKTDPNKAEYSVSRVASPYDPNRDEPLKPGEELITGDNGQQMVQRTLQTPQKPNIYVTTISLRPVDVSDSEKWLVGPVGIMNESRAMSITDIQISFLHGGVRTVILGGKNVDPSNPLRASVLGPRNGDTFQCSSPVKYSNAPGSMAMEIELVVDGPPGIILLHEPMENALFDPNSGNRVSPRLGH